MCLPPSVEGNWQEQIKALITKGNCEWTDALNLRGNMFPAEADVKKAARAEQLAAERAERESERRQRFQGQRFEPGQRSDTRPRFESRAPNAAPRGDQRPGKFVISFCYLEGHFQRSSKQPADLISLGMVIQKKKSNKFLQFFL